MNAYISRVKNFLVTHRSDILALSLVALSLAALIGLISSIIYWTSPKVIYEPVYACDLLTSAEARELLGPQVIHSVKDQPVVIDNTATSRCGYSDQNEELADMRVAAVIVRSGVNDAGVRQNIEEFLVRAQEEGVEPIEQLGEQAFYNPSTGQLHVLTEFQWIIMSYGVGEEPLLNTVQEQKEMAYLVVEGAFQPEMPSF